MTQLEVLGWWFREAAPNHYPRPQLLVSPWDPTDRAAVLAYLRAGQTVVAYGVASYCRFDCGERDMGDRDLTDGTFVWPDGLAHYVEQHSVRLPPHFLDHVRARRGVVAPFEVPAATPGRFDQRPWLAWARAEGACLDLAGWDIPTPAIVRRIEAELGDIAHEVILLCRGDRRQVVLQLADGSLAVHQLQTGGHAPQHLAGWHEWPIDGRSTLAALGEGAAPAPHRPLASDEVFAALRQKFGRDKPST